MAVNPVTNLIYVVNVEDATMSVINGATSAVVGSPITVRATPPNRDNPVTTRFT